MNWLKKLMIVFVILLLSSILAAWVYIRSFEPDYNEKRTIEGLHSKVEVYYDQFGIPHIYANDDEDAYYVLGYVHAKDRLWQMELLRRIAPGRLSEIFGTSTIKTDKFFKALQIDKTTEKAVADFDSNHDPALKSIIHSYIKGVNEFINSSDTPIEYKILGLEKSPYTLEDVYNVMGYMAFSFAMAHKTEPVTTYIQENRGINYLN